ncbi:unnamed protein product [Natator depressus]
MGIYRWGCSWLPVHKPKPTYIHPHPPPFRSVAADRSPCPPSRASLLPSLLWLQHTRDCSCIVFPTHALPAQSESSPAAWLLFNNHSSEEKQRALDAQSSRSSRC